MNRYSKTQVESLIQGFETEPDVAKYRQLANIAYGKTPWSCSEFETLVLPVLDHDFIFDIIREFPKQSKTKPSKLNIQSEVEPESRYELVSQVYVLIKYFKEHKNWNIITSYILNLFNDHQMLYKTLACDLLLESMKVVDIQKTGLVDMFTDCLYSCLTYLPSSIMQEDPTALLNIAYTAIIQLQVELIELLNRILMSVDKVFNRFGESSSILHLQLKYLLEVTKLLGPDILVSFSRVNFLLNQMLINPYIDVSIIGKCLEIQHIVLVMFETQDIVGKNLVFDYRFDLVAAWKIMAKNRDVTPKVNSVAVGVNCTTASCNSAAVSANFATLESLAAALGKQLEVSI